jgi:hypothetical protein
MGDSASKYFENEEENRDDLPIPTEGERESEMLLRFWSIVQKHGLEFEVFSTSIDIAKDNKYFSKADILVLAMGEWDLL